MNDKMKTLQVKKYNHDYPIVLTLLVVQTLGAGQFRTILMADDDGIVPLVGLPGEPRLMDQFEKYCINNGFSSAQIMQMDSFVGHPINEYIEHKFFKNFSDYLKLFMYLPKTPFIWHLSSGEHQSFEAFISIYKWNTDS